VGILSDELISYFFS